MIRHLPRERGRALALAILLGIVLAGAWLVISLRSAYSANAARIVDDRVALDRAAAMAAQDTEIDQWSAGIFRSLGERILLTGSDPSVTSAALQSRLAETAATHQVDVTSFRPLDPTLREGFLDVGVELDVRGNLAGIGRLLTTIESSRPILVVEKARFRSEERGSQAAGHEPTIVLQVEVHGFLRPADQQPEPK